MALDKVKIETLVEIITREVLLALADQEEREKNPDGSTCVVDMANGVKVKTCFNNAGHVISAGAERLTSTVGVIPEEPSWQDDRPHLIETGCHRRQGGPVML
jgi:deoxyribose-phosphate aldolase